MALQVWLPLTGDAENQGVSSIVPTNNSATYYSTGGKLGGYYAFGTGASSISLPTSTFTSLTGDFSVACWVKIISWNSSYATIWAATSTSAGWANIIAGMFRNGSTSKILFCIGNNTSSTQANCLTSADISLNTWYHFVCTYTAGKISLYQNDTLVSSYTTSIVPAFSTTQIVNIGKMRDNTYQSNCAVNDFRLYDICLTADEIHEIYLGKIAHYHLDDNAWGGINLWRNSSCRENLTDIVQSTNTFSITNKDGYQCAHLTGALNTTGHLGIPDTMIPENGSWYTISADMRLDNYVAGSTNPYVGLYFGGSYIDGTWYSVNYRTGDGDAANQIYPNNYNNKGWHRVYITGQYYKDYPSAFRLAYVYARDFTGDLYVKNIKFEKGKHTSAPDWVPADGDTIFGSGRGPTQANLLLASLPASPTASSNYAVADFSFSESLIIGQTYTVSAKVSTSSEKKGIAFYHSGGSYIMGAWMDTTVEGIYTQTFTATANMASQTSGSGHGFCRIYVSNNAHAAQGSTTVTGTATVHWVKVERGIHANPWTFNITEPQGAYDCSGYNNNLCVLGTPTLSTNTPKYMASTYFNGSSGFITPRGNTGWFQYDKCTVMAWMKPTTTPSSFVGSIGFASDSAGATSKGFCICNDAGKFTVYVPNGSWTKLQAGTTPLNEWHHYAATLDDTTVKMYVDGSLVKTSTISWGSATRPLDGLIQVGVDLPGGDEYYTGYYSDIRLYVTPLSANDISKIYEDNNLS